MPIVGLNGHKNAMDMTENVVVVRKMCPFIQKNQQQRIM
jgi:hypothetical protein